MLWADTTAGIMKMRNGANSAFISLWELDGTFIATDISLSAGTAGAPSLYFTGDTNTGIYSPGADQVAITTGGTQRLAADTAAVTSTLPVVHPLGAVGTPSITFTGDLNTGIYSPGADQVAISTAGSGRLFIDASGKILVGTSSWTADNGFVLAKSATALSAVMFIGRYDSTVTTGNGVGQINFGGTVDETIGATLTAVADADWTHGTSHPTRFVFSTTPSGSATPTERLRITSDGKLGLGTSSVNTKLEIAGSNDAVTENNTLRFTDTDVSTEANQQIGKIEFYSSDASTPGAGVKAYIGAFAADTTPDAYLAFATQDGSVVSTPVERLRITSDGKVGIGTTSVSKLLHLAANDGNAAILLARSNSGVGSLGQVGFSTVNGTVAGIDATSVTDSNNGALRFWTTGGSPVSDVTSLFERARIDSSGRLLVGTSTSPSSGDGQYAKLVVQANTGGAGNGAYVSLQRGEAATTITTGEELGLIAYTDSAGNSFGTVACQADGTAGAGDYPGRLVFSVTADGAASPTERMRIKSDGEVKINEFTSSGVGLSVREINTGSVVINADSTRAQNTTWYSFYATSSSATVLQSYIRGDGAYGSRTSVYGGTSDIKLKENIEPAGSQWSDIKCLQIKKFNFIGDGLRQIGVIAQEVEEVSPGLVDENIDRDSEGNDLGTVTKSVKYSILYMKAVKALQEAMERIEQLETKVAVLEAA
jgi:hypothetical protein